MNTRQMRNHLIKICTGSILCLLVVNASGQDINYSQYYTMMPAINPAAAGAFGGDYRFSLDYRKSNYTAADPFTTIFASVDAGLGKYKKVDGADRKSYFGCGLSFLNDKAGEGELALQEINVMLAYNLNIATNHYLTLGTQFGTATRSINYSNLRWSSQYDDNSGVYDPNAYADPLANYEKANYMPISIGLLWNYAEREKLKINAGIALKNVNEPESSFEANPLVSEKVPMQIAFHTAAEWNIPNTTLALMPHLLYRSRQGFNETTFGVITKLNLSFDSKMTHIKKSSAAYAGIFYRTSKDLVLLAKFDLRQNVAIGLSYDIDVKALSDAAATKKRSALEVVITYSSWWKETRLLPRKGNTEFF
jgi:type IX secretion system PorP/SprF family membrane protein